MEREKAERLRRLDDFSRRGESIHDSLEDIARDFGRELERYLDQGAGACHLRRADIADLVAGAMRHFHESRYLLREWVVMPNHAHALLWPMPNYRLSDILKSWKQFTSRRAKRLLGMTEERFWQPESYDHWIRNDAEAARVSRYIRNNPVIASLCARPRTGAGAAHGVMFRSADFQVCRVAGFPTCGRRADLEIGDTIVCSADFQVCRAAGFPTCGRRADLEIGDTAVLENCAMIVCSADFQVCCAAGFSTCGRRADLEIGDTAVLENCAMIVCSADFQVCCAAGFSTCGRRADLEIGDWPCRDRRVRDCRRLLVLPWATHVRGCDAGDGAVDRLP